MQFYLVEKSLCPLQSTYTIVEKLYLIHIFFLWSKQCSDMKNTTFIKLFFLVGGGSQEDIYKKNIYCLKKKVKSMSWPWHIKLL